MLGDAGRCDVQGSSDLHALEPRLCQTQDLGPGGATGVGRVLSGSHEGRLPNLLPLVKTS